MVVVAGEDEVVEVGEPVRFTGLEVMGLAVARWAVTSREHAPPVAYDEGSSLGGGGGAGAVADVEDLTVGAGDDAADIRVAAEAAEGVGGEVAGDGVTALGGDAGEVVEGMWRGWRERYVPGPPPPRR